MSEEFFRPRLKKTKVKEIIKFKLSGEKYLARDSREKSKTAKDNISSFFSQLGALYFGGRAQLKTSQIYVRFGEDKRREVTYLSPDIVDKNSLGTTWSEVKTLYENSSTIEGPTNQLSNSCYFLLNQLNSGDSLPNFNYLFWRYGDQKKSGGFHKMSNGELVRFLASKRKKAVSMPLNLMLAMYQSCSRRERNHEKSNGPDFGSYWGIAKSKVTSLLNGDIGFVEEGLEKHIAKSLEGPFATETPLSPEDFFLDRITVNLRETEPIKVKYHGQFEIPSFPVVTYSLSEEDHITWLEHFSKNHQRMLKELNLRNVFQMRQDWKTEQKSQEDEVPF